MTRLTNPKIGKLESGVYTTVSRDEYRELVSEQPSFEDIYRRLCSYEDTGLEPEDINELCDETVLSVARLFKKMIKNGEIGHLESLLRAEAEGRLIILPCEKDS